MGRFPRGFGAFGGLGGLGAAVHGQATVRTSGGGYKAIEFQVGQVTAVSQTSITVKSPSPDKFTATYNVSSSTLVNAQRDGINSVKTNDQVRVIANTTGNVATNITDITQLQKSRPGLGFGPGTKGPAPAAAAWAPTAD
jgi:hypothetical protein